ncbi:hypothetical protein CJ030_MR2G006269 [Morella rubra]|uniref:Uncharacterized protein n=1 Tax=Morella rubra TaxID=262757 RepID=A0A6A1WBJ1_9ROSI|nr:hypothetical protein CJ030_MR2G006263 [Morella rubra]KAB1221696.1 hypothetical protein CJ030_MR2G006269 [Morella rubra]
MEKNEAQRIQTVENFNMYRLLKRILQIVLSVSLLSSFVCYSSGFCFFPHSFNVYFSTFLFSLFTRTLERKYVFLICNWLLVILAKSSASRSATSDAELGGEVSASDESAAETSSVEDEEHVGSIGSQENTVALEGKEKGESEAFVAEDEEESGVVRPDEEEEVAPAENDELNRRFEEFIRKMKEEIRIEAQQSLIAV